MVVVELVLELALPATDDPDWPMVVVGSAASLLDDEHAEIVNVATIATGISRFESREIVRCAMSQISAASGRNATANLGTLPR